MAMISEVNSMTVFEGWWIDTGASRHVCNNRAWFKNYSHVENEIVSLGNSHTARVLRYWQCEAKFCHKKEIDFEECTTYSGY